MLRLRSLLAAALAVATSFAPAAPLRAQGAPASVDVTRATLPNGLQVVVVRDRLAPVVATWMNYKAGADDEPITGLAHAQEHMMFRGSRTIDASQFSDVTAITGGSFNADTQNEITQYFFEMPSQYLDIALHLERSRAAGLLNSQKDWNQERGAITQEVTRDNSSAGYRLYTKMIRHVLAGTPYADPGLGTVASFKKIQAADLKRFYARWYHPNNAIYVIAGNVDPQQTIAKVRALFGDLKPATLPARKPVTLKPATAATFRDNSSDPYTIAWLGYRAPGYRDKDYFAGQILQDVLNSQRGALYDLQATGKALGTFAEGQTYPQAGIAVVGAVVPVTTTGQQAVDEVKGVIAGYQKSGLPADLIEVAKQREIAQAQFQRTSISNLASTWSQTLAVENRTPDEELAGLQRVTVDDVNRVFRRYFDNATATVAISTPKAAAGSAFGEKQGENNVVVPTTHEPLPAFARNVLSNLRVPEETVTPVQERLPNGIKLVVVPSTLSRTVSVRGQILTNPGIQDPPGKEGIDAILGGLFSYGTTTYDRIAYQTELDKIAANASAGASFSLDVLSEHFDRGVDLLADDELHPALPEQAFEIVKRQQVGALTGSVKSPDYLAARATANALYPAGDPARRIPTPQSAGTIAYDDVKSFYAQTFRPDLTTIVVIGDVTAEHARAAIERAFGGWKAEGTTPSLFPPAVPPNKPSAATIPATGRIQSEVRLAQTLSLTYNDPDYPLLQLANTVLSGGFYASMLYHDVREVHGYAYSVDSSLAPGHNRSTFSVTYGADPGNVANAERIILQDLTALQKRPLTAERLTRAKALVLGEFPVRKESYDGLAGQLLVYSVTDRPLDFDRIVASKQLGASPAAVQAAFAKWIRPQGFVRVVIGPAAR